MNILLIEDDEFKAADILKAIGEIYEKSSLTRAASVTSALRLIMSQSFDLCLLDMSLPTFDLSGPGGGGSPQSQGGVEVLRVTSRLSVTPRFIVVTQYPDIEISGVDVPLSEASLVLEEKFGVCLFECLLYEFDSLDWKHRLQSRLKEVLTNFGAATR